MAGRSEGLYILLLSFSVSLLLLMSDPHPLTEHPPYAAISV